MGKKGKDKKPEGKQVIMVDDHRLYSDISDNEIDKVVHRTDNSVGNSRIRSAVNKVVSSDLIHFETECSVAGDCEALYEAVPIIDASGNLLIPLSDTNNVCSSIAQSVTGVSCTETVQALPRPIPTLQPAPAALGAPK